MPVATPMTPADDWPNSCGVAAFLDVNRADSVRAEAQVERAGNQVRDVEAVEAVQGFVGGAAGNVRLAGEVAYDAGNERQGFADVASGYPRTTHEEATLRLRSARRGTR
jgi:hypothetical protein